MQCMCPGAVHGADKALFCNRLNELVQKYIYDLSVGYLCKLPWFFVLSSSLLCQNSVLALKQA